MANLFQALFVFGSCMHQLFTEVLLLLLADPMFLVLVTLNSLQRHQRVHVCRSLNPGSGHPPAFRAKALSSVIKSPRSGMFITLGQHGLMEKLLQSMSPPRGNRGVDWKQHRFLMPPPPNPLPPPHPPTPFPSQLLCSMSRTDTNSKGRRPSQGPLLPL